jgi:hypothetical protein
VKYASAPSRRSFLAWRALALTLAFALLAGVGAVTAIAQGQKPASPQPTAQAQTPTKPAPKTASPAANPLSASDPNLISDFDDGKITVKSGFGWTIATDSIMGGQSTADMKVADGGAQGTKGALRVTGKVSGAAQQPWAGAMYSPGPQPFAPADLSSKKTLSFWAKGDGRTYAALVFTQSGGYTPAVQLFTPESEWKEFRFPLASFNGTDGKDITAIMFSAGPPVGDFSFTIDTVRLE